ncbi:MAG: CCA tRNA nucleotidyltransferase [Prevotellaceae bacterium]|jgi:poly(A) polymerase|nr:CCA tRNA nucleotidyltransferase [Prevotellaceae bacterium]
MFANFLQQDIFKKISEVAQKQGVRVFVIGGYVRDLLLQRSSKDIDIVTEGSGIALAEELGKQLRSKVSIFKNFGTAMLRYGDIELEFVGARKESYRTNSRKPIVENGTLEEDQERRDFTINALALSLNRENYGELIDPFGGIKDLNEGIIRTPLPPDVTYSDDPLRMMRAIRFATQLNFEIVDESKDAIRRNRQRIVGGVVSVERITDELCKIMACQKPSRGFFLLDEMELLELILPQVHMLKGVRSVGKHHHKDNFLHTLQVLDNVAQKSGNVWLRWAALLHDMAKPLVKKYEKGKGWTFHGHELIGAKMVPKIFAELKLPQKEKMRYVQKLVGLHLRPIALSQEEVTDSAVRRLLFEAGDDVDDLMLLCEADITSKNEQTVKRHLQNFEFVRTRLREIEEKDHVRNLQPPISGELIMQTYNLPPSREVGLIKEAIKEAILNGEIRNNYEEAFEYMQRKAKEIGVR